eukprot:jgi/Botrbrau1/16600/Bobra.0068s0029.1
MVSVAKASTDDSGLQSPEYLVARVERHSNNLRGFSVNSLCDYSIYAFLASAALVCTTGKASYIERTDVEFGLSFSKMQTHSLCTAACAGVVAYTRVHLLSVMGAESADTAEPGDIGCCAAQRAQLRNCIMTCEFRAASHAVKEAIWLRGFLEEIHVDVWKPPLFIDNSGCVRNSRNLVNSKYTKHVAVAFCCR